MTYNIESDRLEELTDFDEDRQVSQTRSYGEAIDQMRNLDEKGEGCKEQRFNGQPRAPKTVTVDGDYDKGRDWFIVKNAIEGSMAEDFNMGISEVSQNSKLLDRGDYQKLEKIIEYAAEGDL